ncbi:MAG: carbamate kinase [Actinomycetota bacterium]|nr:carbamate kinase [Actinomycetota bacterium]
MGRIVVLALGGNALCQVGQAGTYEEHEANAALMARSVCSLIWTGWEVVVVHGNGPQVGNLAIQQEEGSDLVPAQPLFVLGGMTQGQLGSLLTLALRKVAGPRGPDVVSVVTHALVDPNDSAFSDPTKPIGPFLSAEEAKAHAAARGWTVREDAGRGWRRVVPSPEPLGLLEAPAIRALLNEGFMVVAGGGGGIPLVPTRDGYRGVEAVIDKDYAASALATSLGASALVLVTSVESVLLDYGTPRQRPAEEMTLEDAERHLAEGQFPEGSMGPKVRSATRFLRAGGEIAVITTPALVYASLEGTVSELEGKQGTRIVRLRQTGDGS